MRGDAADAAPAQFAQREGEVGWFERPAIGKWCPSNCAPRAAERGCWKFRRPAAPGRRKPRSCAPARRDFPRSSGRQWPQTNAAGLSKKGCRPAERGAVFCPRPARLDTSRNRSAFPGISLLPATKTRMSSGRALSSGSKAGSHFSGNNAETMVKWLSISRRTTFSPSATKMPCCRCSSGRFIVRYGARSGKSRESIF